MDVFLSVSQMQAIPLVLTYRDLQQGDVLQCSIGRNGIEDACLILRADSVPV